MRTQLEHRPVLVVVTSIAAIFVVNFVCTNRNDMATCTEGHEKNFFFKISCGTITKFPATESTKHTTRNF